MAVRSHDNTMSDQPLLTLCTCPDLETAKRLASAVVEERLAACVNLLGGLLSVYRWQGHIEQDTETLLLIKTRSGRFAELSQRLAALHPYEVPEIIALPITDGLPAYFEWIDTCTDA